MNNLVQIKNNRVVVSSKQVAKSFYKEHKTVLRSINDILVAQNCATNFYKETFFEYRGRTFPMYLMDRNGFSLLVMGFTGKEALEWKIKYIEAFNEMESQLKSIKEDDLLIDDKTGFRGVEPIGNNTTDIIRIINGTLFTNSCIVAERFGIAQADIVENIKRIIKALSLNPVKNMYFTRDNLNSMLYYITQEEFSLITMGFTSQKAIMWKAIFLNLYNKIDDIGDIKFNYIHK